MFCIFTLYLTVSVCSNESWQKLLHILQYQTQSKLHQVINHNNICPTYKHCIMSPAFSISTEFLHRVAYIKWQLVKLKAGTVPFIDKLYFINQCIMFSRSREVFIAGVLKLHSQGLLGDLSHSWLGVRDRTAAVQGGEVLFSLVPSLTAGVF